MNLIKLFATHRVAPTLAMIVMVLAGILAIQSLNVGLNPTMPSTHISVSTVWRGASAEDVEKLITNPLEQQLRTVAGVKAIRSTTRDTTTTVDVEMESSEYIQKGVDDIKQRVAQIQSFPTDMEPPIVRIQERRDMVASVLVKGNGEIEELLPLVRSMESDLLDRGADGIDYSALPKQEIAIQIPSRTLFEVGMSFGDVGREL